MSEELETRVRAAMLKSVASRSSFDAAEITRAVGVPAEEIVERLFWMGALTEVGYRRRERAGGSPIFNPYSGDFAGTLYPPVNDDRRPEDMPTQWIIESIKDKYAVFAHGDERVVHDSWRKVGDRVTVRWKRSPTGLFNIISSLEPEPVVYEPVVGDFTIQEWLAEFHRVSGKLGKVSARKLVEEAEEAGFEKSWILDYSYPAEECMKLLKTIEYLGGEYSKWVKHRSWLLAGPLADDGTDDFVDELAKMLRLGPVDELTAALAPYDLAEHDYAGALEATLATFNAAAEANGNVERLYVVDGDFDDVLVVKLGLEQLQSLTEARLLFAHEPKAAARKTPPAEGLWSRLFKWRSKG